MHLAYLFTYCSKTRGRHWCFNFPLKKTEKTILITMSPKHHVVVLNIKIRLSKWDTGWMHRMYMSNIELLGVLITGQLVEQFPSLSITSPFICDNQTLLSISTSLVSTFYLYDLLLVYRLS